MKKIIISLMLYSVSTLAVQLHHTIPAFSLERKNSAQKVHNTVYVTEGNQFTITLHGNEGTGYRWYIQELNENYITLIAKHVLPCRHPGGRTTTVFKFHAIQAGHKKLVFEYARPWSWSIAEKQTFQIIIKPRPYSPLNKKRN